MLKVSVCPSILKIIAILRSCRKILVQGFYLFIKIFLGFQHSFKWYLLYYVNVYFKSIILFY